MGCLNQISISGNAAGAGNVIVEGNRREQERGALREVLPMQAGATQLRRRQFAVADAVPILVQFREPMAPNRAWQGIYETGLQEFERRLG